MVEVKIDMCGHISSPSFYYLLSGAESQALRMCLIKRLYSRSIPPFLYFHICFSALAASPFLLKSYHLIKKRHHHRYTWRILLSSDFKFQDTGTGTICIQGILQYIQADEPFNLELFFLHNMLINKVKCHHYINFFLKCGIIASIK